MGKRVVIDASVAVDLIVGRDEARVGVAEEFFNLVQKGFIEVYAPRLFLVETGGVIVRYIPRNLAEEAVNRLAKIVATVPDEVFYKESIRIALKTGSRGADAYYIGLANTLNIPLATNDRVQAINARKSGVRAFYLIEEINYFKEYVKTQ